MPSVTLKANGIITSVRNAGTASVKSSHSMVAIPLIMRLPTMIKAGAIAGFNPASPTGAPTILTSGSKKSAPNISSPVTMVVSPVRPPAAMPDELSM